MSQITTRSATDLTKMEEIMDKKLSEFAESLASKEGIDQLKSLFRELNVKIEQQNNEIISLKNDMNDQNNKISTLENKVGVLEDKVGVLTASISALKAQSDNQEQYSRRYCLRIQGIDQAQYERGVDCVTKVIEVCKNLNINIEEKDIDRAHRVGKDRKTMIVKFFSFPKRTSVYKARKNSNDSNGGIRIPIGSSMVEYSPSVREITDNCPVDFVFADINCNLVAKLKNNKYTFFDNLDYFKLLI